MWTYETFSASDLSRIPSLRASEPLLEARLLFTTQFSDLRRYIILTVEAFCFRNGAPAKIDPATLPLSDLLLLLRNVVSFCSDTKECEDDPSEVFKSLVDICLTAERLHTQCQQRDPAGSQTALSPFEEARAIRDLEQTAERTFQLTIDLECFFGTLFWLPDAPRGQMVADS